MKRVNILINTETKEILAVDVKAINCINLDSATYFVSRETCQDLPDFLADSLLALPWKFEKEPEFDLDLFLSFIN